MYIVVRTDLSPAHQLIQACHAAHEAGIRYGIPDDISSLVVCSVPDEAALRLAAATISLKGIKKHLFVEDDFGNQATAFATEPISGEKRRAFKNLPLWVPGVEKVA